MGCRRGLTLPSAASFSASAKPSLRNDKPECNHRSYRTLRGGSFFRASQAINCLATFILFLRDKVRPRTDSSKGNVRRLDPNYRTLNQLIRLREVTSAE